MELLRLALLAKVDHETGKEDARDRDWADAVVKAENDSQRLDMLQKLAFQWRWPEKGVAALWLLADLPQTSGSTSTSRVSVRYRPAVSRSFA